MLASKEQIVVQDIRRHLEHAPVSQLRLNSRKLVAALPFFERFKPRNRRADLCEQTLDRALVFNVEFPFTGAFEDSFDVGPCDRRTLALGP